MSSALKICRKDIFPAIVAIFNWITKKPNGDGGSAMFLFVDLKIISDYDKASVSRAKLTKSWNLNNYIYINMYLIGRILNLNALIILVFSLQVNDFQFTILSKIWQIFLHSSTRHVEFPFKFFDRMANKSDFLKSINLFYVVTLTRYPYN